jgi:hypothetical protein
VLGEETVFWGLERGGVEGVVSVSVPVPVPLAAEAVTALPATIISIAFGRPPHKAARASKPWLPFIINYTITMIL